MWLRKAIKFAFDAERDWLLATYKHTHTHNRFCTSRHSVIGQLFVNCIVRDADPAFFYMVACDKVDFLRATARNVSVAAIVCNGVRGYFEAF